MTDLPSYLLSLELSHSIWDRFFTVAPLVVIGTRASEGAQNLFATHRAFPFDPENLFAFLASPAEPVVQNCLRERAFSVSFPHPRQIVEASLATAPAGTDDQNPLVAEIQTFRAREIDAPVLAGARLGLECRLERVVEDLGTSWLIVGTIVAAHLDRDTRRVSERDDYDLVARHPLLAFVAPGRFAEIEHTDTFPSVE